jgi:NADH-quinone oxidoreductase subunit E
MTGQIKENQTGIAGILAKYPADRGSLIPILQDIQEDFGYLPQTALEELEKLTGISLNEIYGVATFYAQFRFGPPGEHTIRVCQGTACHVRGGHQILVQFEQCLGTGAGETTPDGRFSLERVACLGCCALAPVVTVDGKVHAVVTAKKVPAIISQYGDKAAGTGKGGDD